MTNEQLLEAIGGMIRPIQEGVSSLKQEVRHLKHRMDDMELQVKQTEIALRNEIRKESELVLDEVQRVHSILIDHINDKEKHTA